MHRPRIKGINALYHKRVYVYVCTTTRTDSYAQPVLHHPDYHAHRPSLIPTRIALSTICRAALSAAGYVRLHCHWHYPLQLLLLLHSMLDLHSRSRGQENWRRYEWKRMNDVGRGWRIYLWAWHVCHQVEATRWIVEHDHSSVQQRHWKGMWVLQVNSHLIGRVV